jgi:hypothetical protein
MVTRGVARLCPNPALVTKRPIVLFDGDLTAALWCTYSKVGYSPCAEHFGMTRAGISEKLARFLATWKTGGHPPICDVDYVSRCQDRR